MRISIDKLTDNMIIDEDLFDNSGNLILSKGYSVQGKDDLIELLKTHDILKVKVLLLSDFQKLETDDDAEIDKKIDKPSYSPAKRREFKAFVNEFNIVVNNFEKEIAQCLLGEKKADRQNLEYLLEDVLNTNLNKTTNVFQLLQKLKDKDDVTFIHCNSVSLLAYKLGSWLKLSRADLKRLALAALLSDIGKYQIPKEILNKKEPVTFKEFEILKGHVNNSLDMLKNYNLDEDILNAVRFHHERCDGSGYPYGLKGEQIPAMSKIIAIADMFAALTSVRPYRDKFTPFEAISLLETDYMQKLDIVVLSEFIRRVASNYIGNPVKLSNGQEAEIIFINPTAPLKPIVKIFETNELVDLSSKPNQEISILEFF